MKHSFKMLVFICFLVLIICSAVACASNKFVIPNNDTYIKSGIESFINRGNTSGVQISLKKEYSIDNKKIVSFVTNNGMLGNSEMEIKNDGEQLKVGGTGYGTNRIECRVFTTNKYKYLVLIGGDYKQKIKYIKVDFEGKKYIFDIDGESYFIQSYIVPENSKSDFSTAIWFYDDLNKDITNEVELDVKY